MPLITHHIETDEGHHNHVKLFVGDDPKYDCLRNIEVIANNFLQEKKSVHLGTPVWSWKRFHWFFPARLLHCGNVPAATINGRKRGEEDV